MSDNEAPNAGPDEAALREEASQARRDIARVCEEVHKVIVGQERVVECTVTALLCGGNVLLEGVPGLGKTELVKTLSRALDLDFKRIQFTPDLMPADIIGTNIMTTVGPSEGGGGGYRFEFRRGPAFTQLLLADEINRATPKTQSALLEAMQEKSVTAGGTTYAMKRPYFVLATQNPIEQEGTYPLPEAQLDRFMFKVNVPFLNREELNQVVDRTVLRPSRPDDGEGPTGGIDKIMDSDGLLELRRALGKVVVAEPVRDYATRLVLGTHGDSEFATDAVRSYVRWGASPRAAQALIRAARVRAVSEGRAHVSFADVRYFGAETFAHRVILNYDGQAENVRVAELVRELTARTPEEAE